MKPLSVCLVGGVFDKPREYQVSINTPETILARSLRSLGCEVTTCGHRSFAGAASYDVVHVHHLGRAALKMASEPSQASFIFTGHDGRLVNGYQVSRAKLMAMKHVLARADAVVALTRMEMNWLEKLTPLVRGRVSHIPNGIPDSTFFYEQRESPVPLSERPLRLLYVGQLIPLKGVDVLLRALSLIKRKRQVRLSLVYHHAPNEAAYKELAESLGLGDSVEFLGRRSSADLAGLYRCSDIFVLPSHAEALPSVISEAMMCGLPVVASDIPTIREQVDACGYLSTVGDERSVADAIDRATKDLIAGVHKPAALSRAAVARYGISTMGKAHQNLYSTVLQTGRRRKQLRYLVGNLGARALLASVGERLVGRGLIGG